MLPTSQVIAAALMALAGAPGERTSHAPDSRSARDAFVGLLDARGVAFVQGSGPALYLESGGGRLLCVTRGATGPRCHAWPTGASRLATISNGYADDRTFFYATTADADLELRVDSVTDDVSVFKITCKSDGRPLDFTVPPSRRQAPPAPLQPRPRRREAGRGGRRVAPDRRGRVRGVARSVRGERRGRDLGRAPRVRRRVRRRRNAGGLGPRAVDGRQYTKVRHRRKTRLDVTRRTAAAAPSFSSALVTALA